MLIRSTRLPLLGVALTALLFGGCRRAQSPIDDPPVTPPVSTAAPFRVTSLDLGSAIDESKRVPSPSSTFAPTDTIYAAVLCEGSVPNVEVGARWTLEGGGIVSESSQVLAAEGPAATEFHLASPSGLPVGKYKIEVTANGATAASQEFEVK